MLTSVVSYLNFPIIVFPSRFLCASRLPSLGGVGGGYLERVQDLFLNLFQFILHLHHDVLHLGLVRL